VATEGQPAKQAKLLVVEDDVLVRMLLADMVGELGYALAAEAASIDEALEATRKTDFDLAILDVDLKGRSVSPVADALVARDIGFVFVTGYDDHGPKAVRAKQLRGLALARSGETMKAQLVLGKLYAAGEIGPETLGILARTWMDRYNQTNEKTFLLKSRDLYRQAFEAFPSDYYTGINAAGW